MINVMEHDYDAYTKRALISEDLPLTGAGQRVHRNILADCLLGHLCQSHTLDQIENILAEQQAIHRLQQAEHARNMTENQFQQLINHTQRVEPTDIAEEPDEDQASGAW